MTSVSNGKILNGIFFFLVLLTITYVSYFLYFPKMGLYEDDYYYIGKSINLDFNGLVDLIKYHLSDFEYNQGRYIGESLPYILIHIIFNLFGFKALYIFGCILISFNAYLFAKILLKAGFNNLVAILAGLFFILFPADTTKPLLIHIYLLQLSFTFVLAGILVFPKNRIIGFVIAAVSLFIYESAFLPFLTIPLLFSKEWDKKTIIKTGKHMAICLVLLATLFILRKLVGEQRVGGLTMTQFILDTFFSLFIGPVTVFYTFLHAPYMVIKNIDTAGIIIVLIIFIPTLYFLLRYKFFSSQVNTVSPLINVKFLMKNDSNFKLLMFLLILGILDLGLSYLMSVTHYPPTAYFGRGTSVHLASTFGASLLFAAVVAILLKLIPRYKNLVFGLTAIFLSLLMGYGLFIQSDFLKSWNEQKKFWSRVNVLCDDVKENTIIFVERKELKETKFVSTYSWAVPLIYESIYNFHEKLVYTPKVVIIKQGDIIQEGEKFYYLPGELFFMFENRNRVELLKGNVILLKKENNELIRANTGLGLPQEYFKRYDTSDKFVFKPLYLHELILGDSN